MHVETCVGQTDGGFRLDPFAETEFVHSQCAALGVPFKIVAFVNLSEPDAEVAVKKHLSRSPHVVGVRMITNFVDGHPDWTYPQVRRCTGATWRGPSRLLRARLLPHPELVSGVLLFSAVFRWSATTGAVTSSSRPDYACLLPTGWLSTCRRLPSS